MLLQKEICIATGLLFMTTSALSAEHDSTFSGNEIEEINVIGSTPLSSTGITIEDYTGNAQLLRTDNIVGNRPNNLSELLINNLGSISVNTSQSNPYQNDIYYRGFLASPLVGSAIGLSVYMDGVRINEGFGDTINWDLIPQSAISTINVIPGSNPVFGLNTLGGALSVQTKSGNIFQGTLLEASGGAWERYGIELEHGGYQDELEWYLLANIEEEEGWRDRSPSDIQQLFGKIGWESDNTDFDLTYLYNDNDLIGNGFAPQRLLALDREASHTFPDKTVNELSHINLQAAHEISKDWQLSGNAYYRDYQRSTLNGDAEVECEAQDNVDNEFAVFTATATADNGNAIGINPLPISLCSGAVNDIAIRLNQANLFNEDGNIIASDAALERHADGEERASLTATESYGGSVQSVLHFNRYGQLILGIDYNRIDTHFRQTEAEGDLQRIGNSVGVINTDPHETAVDIATEQRNIGVYFSSMIDLSDPLTLSVSGRWQHADIDIKDRTGDPENADLNGEHSFARFMPALGLTYHQILPETNVFINYSEGFRVPTATELTCADPDDPCNLPNAFVADPPLEPVIARTIELGARGQLASYIFWNIAIYSTRLDDDLLFITTETSGGGFFDNIGKTQRNGVELGIRGQYQKLAYFADYSYVEATFENAVTLSSVVEVDGIQVQSGDELPGIPKHNFRVGTEYQLLHNLWIGSHILASSGNYLRGDESNQLPKTGNYAVVNLNARWQPHENIEAWLKVDNVLDEKYETAGARNFNANANLIFGDDIEEERFLAPGAPRAAWVGINIRF